VDRRVFGRGLCEAAGVLLCFFYRAFVAVLALIAGRVRSAKASAEWIGGP
jgi:hypothetical protein